MSAQDTVVIIRHQGAELAQATLPPGFYVIGRRADAEISIDLPQLAEDHARLILSAGRVFVEDLGSTGGTFVGEKKITDLTAVQPNDSVRLADVQVEIRGVETTKNGPLPPNEIDRLVTEELSKPQRYRLGESVARGGMGEILQAREESTHRTVAMKLMHSATSTRSVARFIDEARVTAQLEHPNIVPVHDLGVDARGQPYYTMKMVRGITLQKVLDLMAGGVEATIVKYPLQQLLTIFQKICDAIAFAHSRDVLHRDLKPENIMLDDFGVVLVMDWGLSKVIGEDAGAESAGDSSILRSSFARAHQSSDGSADAGDSSSPLLTLAGTILGTPKFMSPEQARGEVQTLDARSDVYSLGAILFQMLYLRPPVSGRTSDEVLLKVQRGEIAWPELTKLGAHLPGRRVPDSLAAVCRKALALDRADRYANVGELQADLAAYQAGFATTAENAGRGKQLLLLVRRHKVVAAALTVTVALGIFATVNVLLERNHAKREAARASQALDDLQRTAPALRTLADGQSRLMRFEKALEELDMARTLDRDHVADLWRRAHLLIPLERFAEAAASLREAARIDPANARLAWIAPLLDKMAAASDPAQRYALEFAGPVLAQLNEADAPGEALALSEHIHREADKRRERVRKQIAAAYPAGSFRVVKSSEGRLDVIFTRPIGDLNGLRNAPFDLLSVELSGPTDLEPLRGLRPTYLYFFVHPVLSLEPLRGMPLTNLHVSCASVPDLEPLRGMPLRKLRLEGCNSRHDFAALLDCRLLDTLLFQGTPANLGALRNHRNLQRISDRPLTEFNSDYSAVTPAAEFWQRTTVGESAPPPRTPADGSL